VTDHDNERDRFILSKGHVAGALYTTLAAFGFLPVEELATFLKPLSVLAQWLAAAEGRRLAPVAHPCRAAGGPGTHGGSKDG
jgi:transketolase N-terminal domain/subunit